MADRTRILSDHPSDADAFAGQGHKRSAKALAATITQLADSGGAIGLEGAWGSGKSTVIRLAKDDLKSENHEYHVFTFDLWTHSTDQFRRAFLEAFIRFIAGRPFATEFDISAEQDVIRNRKKSVTSISRRRYTGFGILFLLLVPFTPLLYAWLNPTAFLHADVLHGTPWVVLFALACFVVSIPACICIAYGNASDAEKRSAVTFRNRLVIAFSELLTLSKNIRDENVVQWIRDEDPTTIEFGSVFLDLLGKTQNSSRRVVFVLDNIDRLPQSSIPDAWSEIRALTAYNNNEHKNPVLVIVPYDRQYVGDSFAEESADIDVFAKTFSRTIRVSPPVPSNWRDYLNEKIEEALPNITTIEEREKLYRLLKLKLQIKPTHPTPRRIIDYINSVGSVFSQWEEDIPISSIALYALFQEEIDKNPERLVQSDFPPDPFIHIVDHPDWHAHLAALTFNVPPELATQVLLGQRVANALTSPSPEALQNLALLDGFLAVFQEELAEFLSNTIDPSAISQSAQNVDTIDLGRSSDAVWRFFRNSLKDIAAVSLKSYGSFKGLFTVVSRQNKQSVCSTADWLRQAYEADLSHLKFLEAFEQGRLWAPFINELILTVGNSIGTNKAFEYWKGIQVTAPPSFFIGVAAGYDKAFAATFDSLQIPVPGEAIAQALVTLSDEAPQWILPAIGPLYSCIEPHISIVGGGIAERLQENAFDQNGRSALLHTEALLLERSRDALRPILQPLVQDGTLAAQANAALKDGDEDTAALGFWLIVTLIRSSAAIPNRQPNPQIPDAASSIQWYNSLLDARSMPEKMRAHLVSIIERAPGIEAWLGYAANDASAAGNWKLVFLELARSKQAIRIFSLTNIFRYYDFIKSSLTSAEFSDFLDRIDTSASGLKYSVSDGKYTDIPSDFLREASLRPDSIGRILPLVDRQLSSMKAAEWEEALCDSSSDVIRIFVERQNAGAAPIQTAAIVSALVTHALMILEGEIDVEDLQASWPTILERMSSGSKERLAKRLFIKIANADVDLDLFDEFISKYYPIAIALPFEDNPTASIDQLAIPAATVLSDRSCGYLREVASALAKCLSNVSKETKQALTSAFDEHIADGGSKKALALEMKDILGLSRRKRGRPVSKKKKS